VDARARLALEDLARRACQPDMDALAVEVDRLRREVQTLERMVGLPGQPPGRRERQARVAELRGRGYSTRAIAQLLHTDRGTVMKDIRTLGLPPAEIVVGLDGRAVRGQRPAARS
jgi:hypothetical protein